ncbi:MAG TPA: energy transducer TonB [Pyrinomonadaceae bacterium]|nr:energy transducer TonB [Pyrinomonadaceae bacterium]
MKKQFLFVASIILFGIQIVSAQTPPAPVKQINKGVVNGSALNLAKPTYPAAARAVNAEGAVNVQVVIDENGDVVSATAVSGHPLLRAAATEAARQSKFAPTLLSGQAVKVTGVLVYNFVGEDRAANWLKIGYDLASAQYSSAAFLNTNRIDKSFGADWTAEKEQLQKLAQINRTEVMGNLPPVVITEKKAAADSEKRPDGAIVKKMMVRRIEPSNAPASGEQIALAQSLVSSLQGRLASSEVSLWQFKTGSNLSQLLARGRNPNDKQNALSSLRQQIQSAPSGVSPESLAELQKLAAILEKTNPTPEENGQIGQILTNLFAN